MKNTVITLLSLLLVGCMGKSFEYNAPSISKEEIDNNVKKTFGVTFNPEHDWVSAVNNSITIKVNPSETTDIKKVQILTQSPFGNGDANGSTVLNESEVVYGESITMIYDAPSYLERLYAACVTSDGDYIIRGFSVGQPNVAFVGEEVTSAPRRAISTNAKTLVGNLPLPVLGEFIDSYAKVRGYAGFENDKLYDIANKADLVMHFDDYPNSVKEDMKDIIFTYLPNKKSNIERIRQHVCYNETSYAITTGDDPIVVEPIYKNDGGYHEVEFCSLYYYYFKEEDLSGMNDEEQTAYLMALPKFKLLYMGDLVGATYGGEKLVDDKLMRDYAYAAVYWGDNPVEGTIGSYQFPKGYKIGFMLRNEGKTVHQGELYCDGRLNEEVNKWGHLASAKLGAGDARMAWLSGNKKNFLCCESGTDRDFNDIVFEVEGGVEPIGIIPVIESNQYSFCFEDSELGDYDMNDLVIKAQRIDATHVKYSITACGAYDELYVLNINGNKINMNNEVHSLFKTDEKFINTVKGSTYFEPVSEIVTVSKTFSFLDSKTQPCLYDKTRDKVIKISQKGEDPHGIMVPYNFRYPAEMVCIKDAYSRFTNWGITRTEDIDWYLDFAEDKVY